MLHKSVSLTATATALVVVTMLSACATSVPRERERDRDRVVYDAPDNAPEQKARRGTVRDIDVIAERTRPTGAGAVLGAVIGGVIGNQVGGGTGRAVATGAGVIGGAVVGNAIEERNRRDDEVFRVTVQLDNGKMSVSEGLSGEAACKVSASAATLGKLLSRDLNPMMAMMTGKLKISNPGEMMKYAKIFGLM